jgi:hypothetical protein
MKKTFKHNIIENKRGYIRDKHRIETDALIDCVYLAFGRHTGISKAWFGLFLYMTVALGLTGLAVLVTN